MENSQQFGEAIVNKQDMLFNAMVLAEHGDSLHRFNRPHSEEDVPAARQPVVVPAIRYDPFRKHPSSSLVQFLACRVDKKIASLLLFFA